MPPSWDCSARRIVSRRSERFRACRRGGPAWSSPLKESPHPRCLTGSGGRGSGRSLAVARLGRSLAVARLGRSLAVARLGRSLAVARLGRSLALALPRLGRSLALALPRLGRSLALPEIFIR